MPRESYKLDSRFGPTFPQPPADFQPVKEQPRLFRLRAAIAKQPDIFLSSVTLEDQDLLEVAANFAAWQSLYDRYSQVYNPLKSADKQFDSARKWVEAKGGTQVPRSWLSSSQPTKIFTDNYQNWRLHNKPLVNAHQIHYRLRQLVTTVDPADRQVILDELNPPWSATRHTEFLQEISRCGTAQDREVVVKRYFDVERINFAPPTYSTLDPADTTSQQLTTTTQVSEEPEMGGTSQNPQNPSGSPSNTEGRSGSHSVSPEGIRDDTESIGTQVPRTATPQFPSQGMDPPAPGSVEEYLQSDEITILLGSLINPDQRAATRILLSKAFRAGQSRTSLPAQASGVFTPAHPGRTDAAPPRQPPRPFNQGPGRTIRPVPTRAQPEPPNPPAASGANPGAPPRERSSQRHDEDDDPHVYYTHQPSEDGWPGSRSQGPGDPPDDPYYDELSYFRADKEFKDTNIGRFEPYENWSNFPELLQVSKVDGKVIVWKDPQGFIDRCEIYIRQDSHRAAWLSYNLPSCLSGIAHPWFWTTLDGSERASLTSPTPGAWDRWKKYLLENFQIPRDTAETILHQQRYSRTDAYGNRNVQEYTQRVRRFTLLAEQPPSFVARNMWDQIDKALVIPYFDRPPVGYDSRKFETSLRDKQETWHLWEKDRMKFRPLPAQIRGGPLNHAPAGRNQPALPPIHINIPNLYPRRQEDTRNRPTQPNPRPADFVSDDTYRNMTPEQRRKLMEARRAVREGWQQRVGPAQQRPKLLTNAADQEPQRDRRPQDRAPGALRLRRRFGQRDNQGNVLAETIQAFDVDNGQFQYDSTREEKLLTDGYYPVDDELQAGESKDDQDAPDQQADDGYEDEPADSAGHGSAEETGYQLVDDVDLYVVEPATSGRSADSGLYDDKYIYTAPNLECYGCGATLSSQKLYRQHHSRCRPVGERLSSRPGQWAGPVLRMSNPPEVSPVKGCGYTYARVQTRGSVDGPVFTACYDTGASRCAVSRAYLGYFPEATVNWQAKANIRGVGHTKALGWAEFNIYHQGNVSGQKMVLAVRLGAWVLDRLDAGLLVGQEFMVPHQVDVLNSSGEIAFGCFGGATVDAAIFAKVPERTHVVRAAANTIIPPRSHRIVPVFTGNLEKQ